MLMNSCLRIELHNSSLEHKGHRASSCKPILARKHPSWKKGKICVISRESLSLFYPFSFGVGEKGSLNYNRQFVTNHNIQNTKAYHWMQYLLTNVRAESTATLLTSHISRTEANRYPIEILCILQTLRLWWSSQQYNRYQKPEIHRKTRIAN